MSESKLIKFLVGGAAGVILFATVIIYGGSSTSTPPARAAAVPARPVAAPAPIAAAIVDPSPGVPIVTPRPKPAARYVPPPADPVAIADAADVEESGTSAPPRISLGPTGGYGAGNGGGDKSVHVRGYTKKNGTYVAPQDRAAPGHGKKK